MAAIDIINILGHMIADYNRVQKSYVQDMNRKLEVCFGPMNWSSIYRFTMERTKNKNDLTKTHVFENEEKKYSLYKANNLPKGMIIQKILY